MSKIHSLKTWPQYFSEVVAGRKRFEIRKNDRDFNVGDCLVLQEWDPQTKQYTREMWAGRVDYLTNYEQKDGYVVMSLTPVGVDGSLIPAEYPTEVPA